MESYISQPTMDLLTLGAVLICVLWSLAWFAVPFKVYAMAKDLREIRRSLPLR